MQNRSVKKMFLIIRKYKAVCITTMNITYLMNTKRFSTSCRRIDTHKFACSWRHTKVLWQLLIAISIILSRILRKQMIVHKLKSWKSITKTIKSSKCIDANTYNATLKTTQCIVTYCMMQNWISSKTLI